MFHRLSFGGGGGGGNGRGRRDLEKRGRVTHDDKVES